MILSKHLFLQLLLFCTMVSFLSCSSDDNTDPDSFTDSRDGQVYKTVKIGSQTWMGENLKYASPSAGTSACYDNNNSNCSTFGRLYDYDAAVVACPSGWRLPSDADWKTLESFLGIPANELDIIGNRGTDQGATLVNGDFKAEKAGRQNGGTFEGINVLFTYWTSTIDPSDNTLAFARSIIDLNVSTQLDRVATSRDISDNRLCVRCLKN
ncbi:MAG: FISUMP domain-containing protein [Microscillaceae bacterium]|nr:FISUMP domain-containing protein [Microscillaceae bacterium]